MTPYNWLRLRQMVEKLNRLRLAYGRLSEQSLFNPSRIAVEEELMKLDREIDREIARLTVAGLEQDLARRVETQARISRMHR